PGSPDPVTPMDERRALKSDRGVSRRERIVVAAVRALVVDERLERVRRGDVRGERAIQLPAPFPVVAPHRQSERRSGDREAQGIAEVLARLRRGRTHEKQPRHEKKQGRSRGPAPMLAHRRHASRPVRDRKSTRLNSSHVKISYAVLCLKKKTCRVPPHAQLPRLCPG